MHAKHLCLLVLLFLTACGTKEERVGSNAVVNDPPVLEERINSPVDGFYNNEDGSPAFELLRRARRTIDLEIYQMYDSDFQASLHEALDRGVRVRVIIDADPLGGDCRVFDPPSAEDKDDCRDLKRLVAKIREKGGTYTAFNKEQLCGKQGVYCFQHGKMILVDEEVALISTGNFNPTNLCNKRLNPSRCNRDYSMVTRDRTVIDALNTIFEKDLIGRSYDLRRVLTREVAEKLSVSPLSLDPLVEFIESARDTVLIQNQYLKDRTLNAALIRASQRGIDVKVMTASACSFGTPDAKDKEEIRRIYSDFDEAGIHSRMFTRSIRVGGKPGYLHSKAIVVDGTRAWVGSVNGSTTALTVNREFGLFFDEGREVRALEKIMLSDHGHRGSETWEESLRCEKDRVENTPSLLGFSLTIQ